jgi:hypothetical protein
MYAYQASDIDPKTIVVELVYSGMACGPVSYTKIFVLQDLTDLADLFECLVRSDLDVDFYDLDTYVSEIVRKNGSFHIADTKDYDEILNEYLDWQRERLEDTQDDLSQVRGVLIDYGTEGKIVDFCFLEQYIKARSNQDWLIDSIDFDEDEIDNNIVLELPGSEEIIAEAINRINEF